MQFRQHQRAAHIRTARLIGLFVLLLLALSITVNLLQALLYKLLLPFSVGFPALFFETNTGLVLLFVLGGCVVEAQRLRDGGGPRVAHWLGGKEVRDPDDATERRLLNVVDEMALASGQTVPRVYVLHKEDAINAFVAGWGPEDLVLCVTRGALDRLTRAELQGLVAHEFGHIKEDDLPLAMRVLSLVWGLSLVHGYGQNLMAPDDKGHVGPMSWLIGLVFSITGWLGWMAGRMLQAAVSRQREFLADASAVQFTRSRDGLGNVLRKLWHDQQVLAGHMRHPAAGMVSYLLMNEPGPASCMSSHPRLSERIRRVCGTVLPPMPAPLVRMDVVEPRMPPGGGLALAASPSLPVPALTAAQIRQRQEANSREALSRLQHLVGPTERRVITLALMMDTHNERECKLWHHMAEGVHDAKRILEDVAALSPNRRVPEFERLTASIASDPIEHRRTLVESARDLLRADGKVSPRERLWWLALRHRVNERQNRQAFMRPTTGQGHELLDMSLDQLNHVTALTTYMARFIPMDESSTGLAPTGLAWFKGVMTRCGRTGDMAPGPSPDADALMHALAGVQELSWMMRPLLLKAWVEEAVNHSKQGVLSDQTADALRLAAGLIDAPLPPMLEAHYPTKP
ncbi:MAG: M48 family metalloprotease [Aquabacterium sp.]|uniref:M48 family metalloprotease n=1 Tax=Aquabacterium sp. TaxID=1872578 RepID=UPI0025BE671D|nr:M48 family metalloprotease [Aquabacterium sp.]MBI5926433.1 M48 family metalloprotease [Aquabacterium sp.]